MGKYTSGPITVRKTPNEALSNAHWYEIVAKADDPRISRVLGEVFESDAGAEQAEANAHLWSVSGDLLDALVKIEADPANVALYLDCGGRHAIAKARGEA